MHDYVPIEPWQLYNSHGIGEESGLTANLSHCPGLTP